MAKFAAEGPQGRELRFGFDSLRERREAEVVRERHDRAHDLRAARIERNLTYEGSVHLEDVQGESGAEVVDVELDAESAELRGDRNRRLELFHENGFRDLQFEATRRQVVLVQGVSNFAEQILMSEVFARQVYAHRQRVVVEFQLPRANLTARLLKNYAVDLHDQSDGFGFGNEIVGAEYAALGMIPTYQCFESDDLAILQGHDRLIHIEEFAPRDRSAQVHLKT